jgi:hypothetical protein
MNVHFVESAGDEAGLVAPLNGFCAIRNTLRAFV